MLEESWGGWEEWVSGVGITTVEKLVREFKNERRGKRVRARMRARVRERQ
jgi:hypothetical protein